LFAGVAKGVFGPQHPAAAAAAGATSAEQQQEQQRNVRQDPRKKQKVSLNYKQE
jgi:hypothetical protein